MNKLEQSAKRRSARGAAVVIVGVLTLGTLQGAGASAGPDDATAAASAPVAAAPATVCVGTQPEGSLPRRAPKGSYPDDTPLYRVLAYIDRTAKDYPGIFTGLSVDDANRAAHVYRIPGTRAEHFDAELCGAAEKGVTIRMYDTDVTEAELKALVDRISGDMDRWKGTFMIWSVGMNSHRVSVGVSDPAKAEPILREAYGEEHMKHIEVEYEEQASID
ncbi:hypothetical protein G5C60_38700 [Streptomyces sp. HC44]|uniref:Uncharacterized protein n=1 Tax=Streptomyces scabichelini TaxID=2711217 RepID=A0A6G4VHT1_9ACTN|nr:hypothetical protein [Streptomyces scabichelini]NGO13370.1 hypothetical protein [Streptomyces scabichelini]